MRAAPDAAITPSSSAKNRRLRVHYLLEPGWKADAAIQGLGRTNRTNQAQPPLFRPIATDVKAEKRFLSTIARRLDTLGAITRGQRQTGGQGLFRARGQSRKRTMRAMRCASSTCCSSRGKVEGCSLQTFEDATGLKLTDANGIKDELPPITTFLNRLLALTIDLQNMLFTAFEQIADRPDRGRHRQRHLRRRAGNAARRELRRHGPAAPSTPIPATGAETTAAHHHPARAQPAGDARRGARPSLRSPRRAAGQRALRPRRGAGPDHQPDATMTARSNAACG